MNADLFDSLERLYCRAAKIIFNLPKEMRSLGVLRQADWHSLSYSYKLVPLKPMQKAFHEYRGLVSEENVVLRGWESETRKFDLSTELIMYIDHSTEIEKLTFRALALRQSE